MIPLRECSCCVRCHSVKNSRLELFISLRSSKLFPLRVMEIERRICIVIKSMIERNSLLHRMDEEGNRIGGRDDVTPAKGTTGRI